MNNSDPDVRRQVWDAVDPSGETQMMVDAAMEARHDLPAVLASVGAEVESEWENLREAGLAFSQGVDRIASAVSALVPRGWAVESMDTTAITAAVRLIHAGQAEEADALLAQQWDGDGAWRTKRVQDRVSVMGASDGELEASFRERGRLLGLAREHHDAGRYEASIPLLHNQIEGIVMDIAGGKKFFTKGTQKADLVDPSQLVSIESSLAALQALYGAGVVGTQMAGSLSRHGVAHGRELAYDTRVNSAKTWSVVDALVQWALPRARALVDARRAERQATTAGSQEVDDSGRRVDDREFRETREMLRLLSTSAMGWYRQRGHFRDDLIGGVYAEADFTKRGLPSRHQLVEQVTSDGQEVSYWRTTVSGWVLGISLRASEGQFHERLFAGAVPPTAAPSIDERGWAALWETPPDWA